MFLNEKEEGLLNRYLAHEITEEEMCQELGYNPVLAEMYRYGQRHADTRVILRGYSGMLCAFGHPVELIYDYGHGNCASRCEECERGDVGVYTPITMHELFGLQYRVCFLGHWWLDTPTCDRCGRPSEVHLDYRTHIMKSDLIQEANTETSFC